LAYGKDTRREGLKEGAKFLILGEGRKCKGVTSRPRRRGVLNRTWREGIESRRKLISPPKE